MPASFIFSYTCLFFFIFKYNMKYDLNYRANKLTQARLVFFVIYLDVNFLII